MKVTTLDELLEDELKDLYSAETQLIEALPKMAQAAESKDLRAAFEKHLEQTRTHAQRIEEICSDLKTTPSGKNCAGMEGLIKEGAEIIRSDAEAEPKQAALIGAAQRVEHYEIAGVRNGPSPCQAVRISKGGRPVESDAGRRKRSGQKVDKSGRKPRKRQGCHEP